MITNFATLQLPLNENIHELCSQLDKFRFHHFVSKVQAVCFRDLSYWLNDGKCIVLLDFAEKYDYIVQVVVQVFYWNY